MAGSFPGGITNYTNPAGNSKTGIAVGGRTLDQFVADHNDDLEAIMAKLGISSAVPQDSPIAGARLYCDANGRTYWRVEPVEHENLLVNSSFQHWQRGAGAFTADGNKTADAWEIDDTSAASISVTRITRTDTASPGEFSLQAVYTHAAGGVQIWQVPEKFQRFKGRQVTFAARLKSTVNGTIKVALFDDSGGGSSSSYNSGTGFQTLSVTYTIGASPTFILVQFIMDVASCTVEISEAWFGYGALAPTTFNPRDHGDEFRRSQRRYEIFGGGSALTWEGYGAAGQGAQQFIPFAVAKGGVPTLTKNGTWGVTNAGQPTVQLPSTKGFTLKTVVTALGYFLVQDNSSDDTLVAEWNP